jgi:hypothetical protein
MTQATSLPEVKPKTIFYIGCDHLTLNMAIIYFVSMLCIWEGSRAFERSDGNLNKTPHWKQSARIGFCEEVSCHNPNFVTCWSNNVTKQAHECEHEPVSKNGYIWNILMIRIVFFRISLCHVGMTLKIFFHMYMDESHKMDENLTSMKFLDDNYI